MCVEAFAVRAVLQAADLVLANGHPVMRLVAAVLQQLLLQTGAGSTCQSYQESVSAAMVALIQRHQTQRVLVCFV